MSDKRNPGAINYFHRRIHDFDDIYRDKTSITSFLNKTIRASVRIRFELAFHVLGDLKGKSVLDIGCGSGRYMFESAKRGAARVVGLDAASGAIEFARNFAAELKLDERTKFIESDFLDYNPDSYFDVIFAVGYFDYLFDPVEHIRKMLDISSGVVFASFPKRWSILSAIRKIRLALNGCPVRYYTTKEIKRLLDEVGHKNYEIRKIFRDYILIVRK